jgi:N-methylhydantoinase A
MAYLVGIDIGGTFTDAVVMDEVGKVTQAKAASTPDDFSIGVLDSLSVAAESIGIAIKDLLGQTMLISHGATAGINAMLTHTGAKTGLITTEGFEDTILIMRSLGRYAGLGEEEIKRLVKTAKPKPIVPKPLIKGIKERVDYKGSVLSPLRTEDAKQAINGLMGQGVQSIAVAFLWSPVNPSHEREIKRIFNDMYPEIYLTISSEIAPRLGEYERTSTTVVNAYIGPIVSRYLSSLENLLKQKGFKGSPLVMAVHGGSLRVASAIKEPVRTLGSGPVAGVMGSKFLAELLGFKNVITTDVGGTSFDVSLIYDGNVEWAVEPTVGQYSLSIPMVDVKSIGAGGGSIARIEPVTNVLKVGPGSAGAVPGPACYDRGGTEPTVTDADLVLGYLNPDYFLGGKLKLNKQKAIEVIGNKIGEPLGVSVVEAAAGIRDIVDAHMSDLIRSATVARGYDPRTCVLFAYGGAGPLHASAYGRGTQAVIVPASASVHSAMGAVTSDIVHTYEMGVPMPVPADPDRFNANFEDLEEEAIEDLRQDGFSDTEMTLSRYVAMRYRRQVHELRTPVPAGRLKSDDLGQVYNEFERLYEKSYGKGAAYKEAGMQIVTFRVEARGRIVKPVLEKYPTQGRDPSSALKTNREIFLRKYNGFVTANIYDFNRLRAGNIVPGPAIIETPVTTILIDADQTAEVDEYLNVIMRQEG